MGSEPRSRRELQPAGALPDGSRINLPLEAEPRATGKAGGREHWHFEYVQNTGVGVPIPFLASAGASKGQAYNCDVYFAGNGKVVEVNYFTTQLGGESVSF